MKKSIFHSTIAVVSVLGALLLVTAFSGCKKNDGKTLYFYNWTYYTPDSVIEKFEQEFGVKVVLDFYSTNEDMYAKLKAGGSGYDIVVPSQDYVAIMIEEGMLQKIDHSQFPNSQYVSDLVLEKATYDPMMEYSVPYFMGAAGIAVNKTRVSDYEHSWDIFARTDLKGRMAMLDDMREVTGDALAYLGYSVNSLDDVQLEEAKNLIINQWKPNLVKFDAEGIGKSFSSGEFWVVQGYAEQVFEELDESKWGDVDFFIPQDEGGPMYIDSLCILKKAKNYDLAMEFINFIHRPEIYAEFVDYFRFPPTANSAAAGYMKTIPHYSAENLVNCEIKEDLGVGLDKYNRIWQDIRFTQ
ncbi:MAG: extracellular solute-binding protein [Spirochaetaceae bacterium]|jgi:spermidine/putrescine transport system substrate-binding protein|nr:extracellular solute-binding protein [Spirochaetaceae bacterium]